MTKIALNFLHIVAGGLISAVLGGIFGAVVAIISPELVKGMFCGVSAGIIRYSAAVGMLWGIFLGFAAMTVSVLATVNTRAVQNKIKEIEPDK